MVIELTLPGQLVSTLRHLEKRFDDHESATAVAARFRLLLMSLATLTGVSGRIYPKTVDQIRLHSHMEELPACARDN